MQGRSTSTTSARPSLSTNCCACYDHQKCILSETYMTCAKTCEPDDQHLEEGGHIEGANTEADRSNKSLDVKEELMMADVVTANGVPKKC